MKKPATSSKRPAVVVDTTRADFIPAVRLEWLRRKHEKAVADYNFANGFCAGLECALLAIEKGRDILGDSIDDGKAEIR